MTMVPTLMILIGALLMLHPFMMREPSPPSFVDVAASLRAAHEIKHKMPHRMAWQLERIDRAEKTKGLH